MQLCRIERTVSRASSRRGDEHACTCLQPSARRRQRAWPKCLPLGSPAVAVELRASAASVDRGTPDRRTTTWEEYLGLTSDPKRLRPKKPQCCDPSVLCAPAASPSRGLCCARRNVATWTLLAQVARILSFRALLQWAQVVHTLRSMTDKAMKLHIPMCVSQRFREGVRQRPTWGRTAVYAETG